MGPLIHLSPDGLLELPRPFFPPGFLCSVSPGLPPCFPSLPLPAQGPLAEILTYRPQLILPSLPHRRFVSPGSWLCEEGPRFSGRGLFGGPLQVGGLRARSGRSGPGLGLPCGKQAIPFALTEERPRLLTKLIYGSHSTHCLLGL